MTYAGYLAVFLGGPLIILALMTRRDLQGTPLPSLRALPSHYPRATGVAADQCMPHTSLPWIALLLHVIVAVVYTTPWDNYLVATNVWWYDPQRVIGLTIGWVPIEEYTFFVLQTLMTGLWSLWLMRRQMVWGREGHAASGWRWHPWTPGLIVAALVSGLWLAAIAILLSGWPPGTYLALELGWFLPPVVLQLIVGAAILWQERRLVALALLPPAIYLSVTDALAVQAGVWTIDPAQTIGCLLGGVLPIEEFIFFTLTNVLIVFGMFLFVIIGQSRVGLRSKGVREA